MSTYRKTWACCGDTTETDAWEPTECPFCAVIRLSELRFLRQDQAAQLAAPVAPTDQQIVDCLARHGIGWGDEQGVTAYPLDGEDAPVYIGAVRELLAAPSSEPAAWAVWMNFDGEMRPTDPVFFSEADARKQQETYGGQIVPLYAAPQGASK